MPSTKSEWHANANAISCGAIFFFFWMRTIAHDDILQSYIYWDPFTSILIWHRSDFNPLKYSRDVNSHPGRKTAFTQALSLQGMKFKLNPCNASAEARTTLFTFVSERLWPLKLSLSSYVVQFNLTQIAENSLCARQRQHGSVRDGMALAYIHNVKLTNGWEWSLHVGSVVQFWTLEYDGCWPLQILLSWSKIQWSTAQISQRDKSSSVGPAMPKI